MANEELKARNYEHALEKAADLILEHGIECTTKAMIAKESNLSIRTIERYFVKREDAVIKTAMWLGDTVWSAVNDRYPKMMFDGGKYTGAEFLEMYMNELKDIFTKYPRLFVFYSEFKIYFSRHSKDYQREYQRILDSVGCRYLTERMYRLGIKDGSLHKNINPESESEYFCRAYFSFLANMAIAYEFRKEEALQQIDRYIARVMFLYRYENNLPKM